MSRRLTVGNIVWGKEEKGSWLGTIGKESYYWARIEKEGEEFNSWIGHNTFSEGSITGYYRKFPTLKEAKDKTAKRLIKTDKIDGLLEG